MKKLKADHFASQTEALIDELGKIHPKGFDLSLGRISALLEKLGNPQDKIPPTIHVAGTNGKGSTIAFLRSILEAAGYSVHVHTSPHLVSWSERYRLAGKLVSDEVLANAISRVKEANDGKPITIFEIMSAVMFVLFSEHDADFSLVEVGLGGRFDATNVISNPRATIITPIALDHQAYLGDTLSKIAFEKAGIIKPNCALAVGEQADEARDVIDEVAAKNNANVWFASQDFDCYRDATGFVFQDQNGLLDLPVPALIGEHQLQNAGLAIAGLRVSGIKVPDQAWAKGMTNVSWPGRLQQLANGKLQSEFENSTNIWVDGGHNPAAGRVVAETLKTNLGAGKRPLIMICGMINTKEPDGYFAAFSDLAPEVIAVPVSESDAGIPPSELAKSATEAGLKCTPLATLNEGVMAGAARAKEMENPIILFCGSLYLVGEVLKLNETPPT